MIRLATPDDAAEMARLLTDLGYPTTAAEVVARWTTWSGQGNTSLVAVASDARLAGMLTLHQTQVLHRPKPVGRITALVVDPSVRGQGIGRALVAAAEDALASAGCGVIEVTTNAARSEAHAFYRRLGYDQSSVKFTKAAPAAEHSAPQTR